MRLQHKAMLLCSACTAGIATAILLLLFVASARAQQDVHLAGGHAPFVIQKTGGVTASGTTVTATLTPSPPLSWTSATGSTLVAECGVNNTGTISVSDGNSNTWTTAKSQTGTTAGVLIAFVPNPNSGSTTVTCTAGTTGVVVIQLYEVLGFLAQVEAQPDATDSGTGSSATSGVLNAGLTPGNINEIAFAAYVLTTNNACTASASWTIDTQQGATGGRLCPARQALPFQTRLSAGNTVATFSSASYAFAAATFQPIMFSAQVSPDPCTTGVKTPASINIASSSGATIVTGSAGKKVFICAFDLVTATAQNIALIEGTGTVCASNTAGMAGGTTAAAGWNFGANGGLTKGNGVGTIYQTATSGDNVCILPSGAAQVSGSMMYLIQ